MRNIRPKFKLTDVVPLCSEAVSESKYPILPAPSLQPALGKLILLPGALSLPLAFSYRDRQAGPLTPLRLAWQVLNLNSYSPSPPSMVRIWPVVNGALAAK